MYFLNYSLGHNFNYNIKNALLWGNFRGHCQEAKRAWQEGRMGKWTVHVLIAAAEFLPIIGQIASLFEALIINTLSRKSKQPTSQGIQQAPISLDSSHCHPRRKLIVLTEIPECRKPLKLAEIFRNDPQNGIFMAKNATFYPFNSEGVRDHGWGCAWRAIQTCLSSYGIQPGFKKIFELGGPYKNLKDLYQQRNKQPLPELNERGSRFAPYETESSWAEPFIGQMVLEAYKIDSELHLLHALPTHRYAPAQVFRHDPLNYASFKQKLIAHFMKEEAAPVMIDDGTYAFSIVGVQVLPNEEINLFIADAHIPEDGESRNGLYSVQLNLEGRKLIDPLTRLSFNPLPRLSFDSAKSWMVLFPKPTGIGTSSLERNRSVDDSEPTKPSLQSA